MQLSITLRDGFNNDTVVLRLNGREVYRKAGLSTDLSISFADAVDVPVDTPIVTLEAAVTGGQTVQTVDRQIDAQETPFAEIRIVDGQLEIKTSTMALPML